MGAGRARPGRRLGGRGREGRDGRLHCGAQRTGGEAYGRGMAGGTSTPVRVNATTSTRLGAGASSVVEWSGREGGRGMVTT